MNLPNWKHNMDQSFRTDSFNKLFFVWFSKQVIKMYKLTFNLLSILISDVPSKLFREMHWQFHNTGLCTWWRSGGADAQLRWAEDKRNWLQVFQCLSVNRILVHRAQFLLSFSSCENIFYSLQVYSWTYLLISFPGFHDKLLLALWILPAPSKSNF